VEQSGEGVSFEGRRFGIEGHIFGIGDVLSNDEIPVNHAVPGNPANQAGGATVVQVGHLDVNRQRATVLGP
jgi:hypothetical protein